MSGSISKRNGITMVEILITIAIIGILSAVMIANWNGYLSKQAIDKDTEKIVEVLRFARSNTLASKNSLQYGVHLGANDITLFSGTGYSQGATGNQVYNLSSGITLAYSLQGTGADVVFKRLTGEVSAYGTITLTSNQNKTRVINIYKTGLVESQ